MTLPSPDRARKHVGLALFGVGLVCGGALLVLEFLLPPLFEPEPLRAYGLMFLGAFLAFPAALMYLTIPRLLDRYDPEPWYALAIALAWGGIVACGIAALINSMVGSIASGILGEEHYEVASAVLSAPLVEEVLKGLGVLGVFLFLRREFDGIVDGIIYATFIGLGFAAVENIIYYAKAAHQGEDVLAVTFFLRGVLSPWVHPLYTSMTGIGLGIAREYPRYRWTAPPVGFGVAVLMHLIWNASATLVDSALFLILLPLWLFFVMGFLGIVALLVRQKGLIIQRELESEVRLGTITENEMRLVCSAFGILRARLRYGRLGEDFVRAIARLALHKWHAERAERHAMHSISPLFIQPLRDRIYELKRTIDAASARERSSPEGPTRPGPSPENRSS
ncbi:MAG: PrsW family intramembrane metalloprotease [Myxococcales bacterium]|nr:PrsW family intramembrane metalloprotease [Myxococcales bacterium]